LKKNLNTAVFLLTFWFRTYWVLSVKAADVMEDGNPNPLITSCQSFLLMTSTRPPRAMTRLNNSNKSKTCFAIIGRRLIGEPETIYEHFIYIFEAKITFPGPDFPFTRKCLLQVNQVRRTLSIQKNPTDDDYYYLCCF